MSGDASGSVEGLNKYVASLDVGTTTIRCHIYDSKAQLVGSSSQKIEHMQTNQGWAEMDEELIFMQTVHVIREALSNANLSSNSISCMGITTQRNTFITWDRDTGEPFHHLITWQDLRATTYVNELNSSFKMTLFKGFFKFLHLFTRRKRFLVASALKFKSAQVALRLKWMLDNNSRLKERVAVQKAMFGTLDTWLLWKLTGKKTYATDFSNASSTAMFDPFEMSWSGVICKLVGIPMHIFPPILDTSGYFGCCDEQLFGAKIPIRALVADQQSSMFGQCCFNVGDTKCTLGTGTFIDCNTGEYPHTSTAGFYPLVGWKMGNDCSYLAEGFASNTGQSIEWARCIGLMDDIGESEGMALKSLASSKSTDLCFVPAFNGFQAPVNDDAAASLMIGMTLNTTKEDIVRSVLNSVAFRFHLLYTSLLDEMDGKSLSNTILCDGGVSNNTYIMQAMCRLANKKIERPVHINATSLGAAYLAGMASGMWKNKEELYSLRKEVDTFCPPYLSHSYHSRRVSDRDDEVTNLNDIERCENAEDPGSYPLAHCDIISGYEKWLKAVDRCKQWTTFF